MHITLVEQGLQLMVVGLGTVFLFLSILVLMTSLMSSAVANWVLSLDPPHELADNPKRQKNSSVEPRTVRIIQAALDRYFDDK
ncbi:MAG: hypothetical protein CBD08_006570 [Cellvibrionales bacterium TMED148]|nr:hypothetical protein [Porticoccaceae bacterium]RPG89136.1 MAG: hypothetical protein CBD08_006570 [Cellvibrionales bacterium TMED148]|tara:strand:+ start:989 stop:1237 length:249 start_codon:yes stop_codon:yes gene_type:complete